MSRKARDMGHPAFTRKVGHPPAEVYSLSLSERCNPLRLNTSEGRWWAFSLRLGPEISRKYQFALNGDWAGGRHVRSTRCRGHEIAMKNGNDRSLPFIDYQLHSLSTSASWDQSGPPRPEFRLRGCALS